MLWNELKALLDGLGLPQASFARLVGVTPRAVALWVAGDREIPGPVEAYTKLLSSVPLSMRQIELARLKVKGERAMRDGMYSVQFSSSTTACVDWGFGMVILDGGRVYGADPVGGKYDGEYTYDDQSGLAELRLRLTFPPNVPAVFGVTNPYEWSVDATAKINPRLDSGQTRITTAIGPCIDAQYRYLRPLPDA